MALHSTRWLSILVFLVLLRPPDVVAGAPAPREGVTPAHAASTAIPAGAMAAPDAEEPTGAVTLAAAIAAALLRNPGLAAFSWEVRSREARALQAGLLPNPELDVEVENLGGDGDRKAFEQTETTLSLSQLVLLGGKRAKRRRVAELEHDLAEWDYETTRLRVLTETTKAFVATLTAQQQLSLAEELERIAVDSERTAEKQMRAGAVPAVEHMHAQVAQAGAEVGRTRAQRDLVAARFALAAAWGSGRPIFSEVRGNLTRIATPPTLADLEGRIEASPDVVRWVTEIERRKAAVSVERAQRIPDPTVSLGGRYFSDNGDSAVVFSVSVPLPVFDRNQGAVLAATRDVAKGQAERTAAIASVHSMLAQRYQDLASAYDQARIFEISTLPAAEAAFAGAREAHRRGLFRYLEVLETQRTLFELRARYLDVLSAYHNARADLELLTGAPLAGSDASGAHP